MAEVWRARSRGVAGFEKTVVIKRVLPSLMARRDFASLLVREAKIAALLNHPNVVQIFELGEEQGAYFIAMEYVHGCDLATAIASQPDPMAAAEQGGLSLGLRLWVAAEAAKALDYAHRRRDEDGRPLQIVHRDVSPQNVLLGYEGQVKVADFGIALADQRGLGRDENPRMLRGKYAYMSPEQSRGEALDNRSDVFALGIVLHEMLVGRRLFKATDRTETLRRVQEADVPALDLARLGAPPLLGEIVHRALARDREARYPSAGAMSEDLSRVMVEMGLFVGSHELSDALFHIAPPDDASRVNKLRVDVLERVGEDATVAAAAEELRPTPVAEAESTRALPTSQRIRSEVRPGVLLMASAEGSEELPRIAGEVGAAVLPPLVGLREACFGFVREPERGASAAVQVALELQRAGYAGPLVVASGELRVFSVEPPAVEPLATTRERAHAVLAAERRGVRVDPSLVEDLGWRFAFEEDAPGDWPRVAGFRRRADAELEATRLGPLVGRRDVMQRLGGALEDVLRGRGRALLLVGASGVGKSRVLAELRASMEPEGAAVLLTHGRAPDAEQSFAALSGLVRDLCGLDDDEAPEARREKLERLRVLGLREREVALLGALVGVPSEVPERPGRPRGIELVVALRKAVRALAADRPVVLAFEDAHWMDEASRQLLDLLLAGLASTRVLAVVTARPGAALPHLRVERLVLRELDPLSAGKVFAHRVGVRHLEEELVDRLERAVGGNPRYLGLLADALAEAGRIEISGGLLHGFGEGALPLPPAMARRVAAGVAALPARTRRILRLVATNPAPIDLSTLAAVEGVPRDVVEPAVHRLLASRMLRGGSAGGRRERASELPWPRRQAPLPAAVTVRGGELVRRAILAGVPEPERERLHARIADVLRRSGAGQDDRVEALAYHSARAGDLAHAPDELERAAGLALERGEPLLAAERYAEAARLLRQAQRRGDRNDGPRRVAELCAQASEVALEAGGVDLAEAVLELAPEVEADARLALRVGLARARAMARRERWSEVVAEVEALDDRLEQGDPTLRARVRMVLGRALLETGQVERAVEAFRDAVQVLEIGGEGRDVGRGLCGLAIALARAGEEEAAAEVSTAALVAAVCHGGAELRCGSLVAAAEVAEARADHALAAVRWAEAAQVAEREELGEELARAAVRAAVAAVFAGSESEAAVWVARAVPAAKAHGLDAVVALAEAVRAALALAAHPDPHFVRGLVRSVDHLEALGRLGEAAYALDMLARAHVALGDVPAAIRTLGRAGPLARAAGRPRLRERLHARADRLARG